MGSLTLAYPSIAGKTTQEQLESMRRYLCSVTEQLNLADWSAKAALTEIAQVIDADGLPEEEKKTTLSSYAALKSTSSRRRISRRRIRKRGQQSCPAAMWQSRILESILRRRS